MANEIFNSYLKGWYEPNVFPDLKIEDKYEHFEILSLRMRATQADSRRYEVNRRVSRRNEWHVSLTRKSGDT
jgi:hypothetical protein